MNEVEVRRQVEAEIAAWLRIEVVSQRKRREFYRDKDDERSKQAFQQMGYYANAYEGIIEDIEAGDYHYPAIERLTLGPVGEE